MPGLLRVWRYSPRMADEALEHGEQWARVRVDEAGNLYVKVEPVVIGDPQAIVTSFLDAQDPELLAHAALTLYPGYGPAEGILAVLKMNASQRAD